MAIDNRERRNSDRFPYIYRQRVADYDGVHFPSRTEFYKVVFQNVSATGIAFLTSRRPKTDHVLVLLGSEPICFIARVVRTFFRADSNMFEIGCEFTFRVAHSNGSEPTPSKLGHSRGPLDIDAVIENQADLCTVPWESIGEPGSV